MKRILPFLVAGLMLALPTAQASDHELPATVYEQDGLEIPPQAMDYDEENSLFIAHPGWIDGKLIHYYKFRMYVPPNYQTDTTGADGGAWGPGDVPIMPLYLPTTAADTSDLAAAFAGVPAGQSPVLDQFPTARNTAYSDFQHLHFVHVPGDYEANSHRDHDSLLGAGYETTPSGVLGNIPVVPEGSRLEDPAPEREVAPIQGWSAWYDGHEAQTFVFETTSQAFADWINPRTRDAPFDAAGSGYEAAVNTGWISPDAVSFVPIWHVNQFQDGVTPGQNQGGPSPVGQRNVIDVDRLDPGYSPLWQVFWARQVPVGYTADQARDADVLGSPSDPKNGFALAGTPMLVNCPNIGPHGGQPADVPGQGKTSFETEPYFEPNDGPIELQGALVMRADKHLTVHLNGEQVGETTSGMMGLWTLQLDPTLLQDGENTVEVIYDDDDDGPHTRGSTAASFTLLSGATAAGGATDWTPLLLLLGLAAAIVLFARYGK